MSASLVLGLISLLLFIASIRMFYLALNQGASERVRQRLMAGQVQPVAEKTGWSYGQGLLRAGLGQPTKRMGWPCRCMRC